LREHIIDLFLILPHQPSLRRTPLRAASKDTPPRDTLAAPHLQHPNPTTHSPLTIHHPPSLVSSPQRDQILPLDGIKRAQMAPKIAPDSPISASRPEITDAKMSRSATWLVLLSNDIRAWPRKGCHGAGVQLSLVRLRQLYILPQECEAAHLGTPIFRHILGT
jgi:hypothetical protein